MGQYSGKKHYAIKKQFDKEFSGIPDRPGIYIGTRYDPEINKTYFYVGQAINLRNRRFDYYKIQTGLAYPTRHFEASLKAHKDGKYDIISECVESDLDRAEKEYIKDYMRRDNYITRNDSLTGSDITKTNANRITKIKKEYEEAMKKNLKHLDVEDKGDIIILRSKKNKDGSSNKLSYNALRTIAERLGLNEKV